MYHECWWSKYAPTESCMSLRTRRLGGAGSNQPELSIVTHSSKPKKQPHGSSFHGKPIDHHSIIPNPTANHVPIRRRVNQIGEIIAFAEGRQALFGPSKNFQSFVRSFQNFHTNTKLITTLCLQLPKSAMKLPSTRIRKRRAPPRLQSDSHQNIPGTL